VNLRSQKGTALIEAAVTIPILLLVAVGIFEFGRAFQTWQVLTNAAREGARHAVTPNSTTSSVQGRVTSYMTTGQLSKAGQASISVNRNASINVNGVNESASQVTVDYPFDFIVLNPVVQLVNPGSTLGSPLVMRATALMRNETQ
jgi:Flp pilus assembly protein TadG